MNRVFFSLGSNLGDTEANIKEALRLLSEKVRVVRVSSFYETEPVGYKDQPWFLNIAAEGATSLSPEELLQFTQSIERQMKRVKTIVNGPRSIDVDILLFNDDMIKTETLTIPHPRMLERAFVLVPLYEIAPGLILDGRYIKDHLDGLKGEKIRKRLGQCSA
ncbi:2-amino-4-hydroxy-6-hydroxymethyldihydropteridinediphosphokinase [Sporobacter termitidis DSM 10068]|uniref:2-amino-4-hydroxy-6-hydroxymethyldihydropteridine diphosphokinase n=1 Tax=Sporobacter termitidis DSM 10068 TaxID=1123282 RepID=A0A1M5UVN6_9FIRM|nr:2-amino-4-hydroxy-6-hydroxymethyldihydropteridine diphosphokinase [Sporobacter termitidis]SHH67004.1 2-amino-4-hydroxy-6-hydroxymethyldihydropteridinediphosphokinase [Sporobacter termitidis DSM 10068]